MARELTKHYDEVRRGTVSVLAAHYATHAPTLLLGPLVEAHHEDLDEQLKQALAANSVKDAAAR